MKSLKEYTPEDVVVLFNGVKVEQFYEDKDDLFKHPRFPVILTVTDNKTGSCVRYDITNTLLKIGWIPPLTKNEHEQIYSEQ